MRSAVEKCECVQQEKLVGEIVKEILILTYKNYIFIG